MSDQEFQKLQLWIKHRFYDERRLQEEAQLITRIELRFIDGDALTLDHTSPAQPLRDLLHMHERAEIFLADAELKAVSDWADKAERNERNERDEKTATTEHQPAANFTQRRPLRSTYPDLIGLTARKQLRLKPRPSRSLNHDRQRQEKDR
jgi:hypothetical protein